MTTINQNYMEIWKYKKDEKYMKEENKKDSGTTNEVKKLT